MSVFSARRLVSAGVLSAALAAALAVPGAASAAPGGEQCSGENIGGKGASLQELSQIKVWTPKFNESAAELACNGTQGSKGKPTVTYTSTGSGAGLRSWGQEPKEPKEINYGPKNGYVGTDEPPNQKQKEEMESHGAAGTLETIPVEQSAVTVSVHLPEGCTGVEGGPVGGRLGMKETTLESVFRGRSTKWSQVLNGAKLIGPKGKCSAATEIKRAVREDGSGTTSIFKKFLWVASKGKVVFEGKTWKELAESSNNTVWPEEKTHPVLKAPKNSGVAKKIAETPGAIGYVNLADARANGEFTPPNGGVNTTKFWVELQNASKPTVTYSDPATNGDVAEKANSNCEETLYTNGKKKFPPESTAVVWNEVTTSMTQKNYALCGFTYDLSLDKFSAFTIAKGSQEEPNEKEVRTAYDYLHFVLGSEPGEGQALIAEKQDYLGLPTTPKEPKTDILGIAREGVKRIGF
jgi:ABC-type phosphate transport system substrate-binding protein